MLFPTFEFLAFFAFVLALNWLLKKWPLVWRLFLLLVSYYFYALWDIRFLGILIILSLFNFAIGWFIEKNFWQAKKFALFCGVVANVLALGFFKYYDFFRVSAETFLPKLGFEANLPFLEIILPIGISFYIFRAISYLVDIHQQKIKAEKSALDFGLYMAFFPYLLAGPITRAGEFLPQLKNGGAKVIEDLYYHFSLILFGLFKKLVLSSFLVLNLTDDIFAVPENHSALGIALAIVAYTLVIYFDFSGYSDMAIGFAGLLGFKTPPNFNFPYLATNLKEFWKRWHISLSSWIKDYIYIPLGGNRKGAAKKHFNLIFSMVAAGLWHGAAGHFIFWGLWHGGGSSVNHVWLDFKKIRPLKHGAITSILGKIFGWLLTFIFVSVGWVFFRAGSFTLGWKMLRGLFNFERPTEPLPILVFVAVVGGVIFLFLEKPLLDIFNKIQARLPFILWLLLILLAFLVLFKMGPETVPPFIYFSF